jgi:transposase/uncharacterized coiled-coil protein SlyX
VTADIPYPGTGVENRPLPQYTVEDIPVFLAIIDDLKRIITEQQHTITELRDENAHLKARIAELEAQVNQNSRNSSRPPSTDGFRRPQTPRKKGERPPGGQKEHKGSTLHPVLNPDEIAVHTLSTCPRCGLSLENVEPSTVDCRQVFDLPPLRFYVTEHRVERKWCPRCKCFHQAEFPPEVTQPVQYGINLKTLLTYFCVYQLLPYERASEMVFDLFGHSLSPATVVAAVEECSRNLTEAEEHTRELLKDAQVLHVDETGMRVSGTRRWLHVACTDLLTCYGYHQKRGAQATDDMRILPAFRGTMIHDFWATYFKYPSSHAICNAHLMRELQGISENYRHRWSEALRHLLIEIKKAVDVAKQEDTVVLAPERLVDFEERYRKILDEGEEETKASGVPETQGKRGRKKQPRAKNLLDRCRTYQQEILRFMKDFTIPFTNNQAERDLRMMKVKQKISGTFRSEEGAMNFCRVRGFISTVKKHGRPVLPDLRGVFEGTPFMPTAAHRVS